MPRLFTALSVSESTKEWLATLRGGLRGARWIDAESYHVTLRYIGDVDDRDADELANALSRIRRAPVTVSLNGLGSFGGRKPHAIWARVVPTTAIMDLQAEQERLIRRLGFPADTRRYTPHVTVARLRGVASQDVADWLSQRGHFSAPTFTAESFALLSSKSSVGGGPYVDECAYPLTYAAAA